MIKMATAFGVEWVGESFVCLLVLALGGNGVGGDISGIGVTGSGGGTQVVQEVETRIP
jgi:hypothetical protein